MRPVAINNFRKPAHRSYDRQLQNLEYLKIPLDNYLNDSIATYYETLVEPYGNEVLILVILGQSRYESGSFNKTQVESKIVELYEEYCSLPVRVKFLVTEKKLLDHPKTIFTNLVAKGHRASFSGITRLEANLRENLPYNCLGISIRIKGKKKDRKQMKSANIGRPSRHAPSRSILLRRRTYHSYSNLGSLGVKVSVCKKALPYNSYQDMLNVYLKNISSYITNNEISNL